MIPRMIFRSCTCALLTLAFSPVGSAAAKIVAETELVRYCGEEAGSRLGVAAADLILLPVEKSHGKFYVYGQTDAGAPQLFNCTFDGKRRFLGIDVQGDHDHGGHAYSGAPKAAMNKCLHMLGAPAKVVTVSDFGKGLFEIIM